jgi:hypothetical protein
MRGSQQIPFSPHSQKGFIANKMSELSQQLDCVCRWLEDDDWRPGYVSEHDSFTRVWYRRFGAVKPRCYYNQDKPGLHIALKMWDHRPQDDRIGFEVQLIAEPDDGFWVRLTAYTLILENLQEHLATQVQKLIRAWHAVQTEGVSNDTPP